VLVALAIFGIVVIIAALILQIQKRNNNVSYSRIPSPDPNASIVGINDNRYGELDDKV